MILPTENLWRIALTQAGLLKGYFRDLGIPRPTEYTYLDYSEIVPQSQWGQAKQGNINLTMVWDRLNRYQTYLLESYRANATNGLIYLTLDKANGDSPGFDFIDVSGQIGILQFANMPGSRGNVKTGTQLFVNTITVLADPASF